MADLRDSMIISASGMRVQNARMRVAAENISNVDSAASTPKEDPYRRKTITFKNELDKATGVPIVKVDEIGLDYKTPFKTDYNPGHPAADQNGYVKKPNLETMIESADLKEAQRSFEANLGVVEVTKGMISRTLDLLR